MMSSIIGPFQIEIELPPMLSTCYNANNATPQVNTPRKKGAPPPKGGAQDRGAKLWWREKPTNDSDNWDIPTGKIYLDFFDDSSDQGRSNQARLEATSSGWICMHSK
jgi:hypothetical protein